MCFLPAIYRRGVRYGACSCFICIFICFFRQLTPCNVSPCVCLSHSLFDLIYVPLSLLFHFNFAVWRTRCPYPCLDSYLDCLVLRVLYLVVHCLFRFCFLAFPPESLSGDNVLWGPLRYRALHGGPHGAPWRLMELHGGSWSSMEAHGAPWRLIEVHGGSWSSMEAHGASWRPMEAPCRPPWRSPWRPPRTSTDLHGDLHGASTPLHGDLHGAPWSSMSLHGDLHEPPWSLHGRPWRPPRTSMERPRTSMEPPRTSMETSTDLHGDLHGPPRTSMDLHGDLHGASTEV